MYAMNIQNDVIGLVLRENCKSKKVTDFIAFYKYIKLNIIASAGGYVAHLCARRFFYFLYHKF